MGARRNHPHLGSHFSGIKCLWNWSKCNKYDYIAVKTMQWYSAIITVANTYIIRTTFEKYKPSLYKHLPTCQMDNPTQEQNKNTHTHFCWSAVMNICFFLAAAVCCSCNANCIEGSRPEVAQILLERLFHGDDPMSIFNSRTERAASWHVCRWRMWD